MADDSNKKFCAACYRLIDEKAEYCPRCGAHIGEGDTNERICPACARKVDANAQYCPQCGIRLSSSEDSIVWQHGVEAMAGWVTGVVDGDKWGIATIELLFTTDRVIAMHNIWKNDYWAAIRHYNGLHEDELKEEELANHAENSKLHPENLPATEAHDARPALHTQVIDELLSEHKNFAVPYSEMTQLRVKLPSYLHRGLVTIITAHGEKFFRILQKAVPIESAASSQMYARVWNPWPANWEFLKSPPPKLQGKLVVDGPLAYVP